MRLCGGAVSTGGGLPTVVKNHFVLLYARTRTRTAGVAASRYEVRWRTSNRLEETTIVGTGVGHTAIRRNETPTNAQPAAATPTETLSGFRLVAAGSLEFWSPCLSPLPPSLPPSLPSPPAWQLARHHSGPTVVKTRGGRAGNAYNPLGTGSQWHETRRSGYDIVIYCFIYRGDTTALWA